jgi:hypothetical protein
MPPLFRNIVAPSYHFLPGLRISLCLNCCCAAATATTTTTTTTTTAAVNDNSKSVAGVSY